MNTYKEKFKSLLQKFNVDPKSLGIKLEDDIKLEAEMKLMDGTSIFSSASEFAIGVDVYTKDADGNPIPAASGEYELEDGTKLIVGEDGLVAEMMTPDMTEEMSKDDIFALVTSLTERVSALETEKKQLADQLSAEQSKREKVATELSSVKNELNILKKAPASPSIKDRSAVALASNASRPEKSFSEMTMRERIQYNLESKKS